NDDGGQMQSAMSIEFGALERIHGHNPTWFVAPFADGKHVGTGGSGVFNRNLRALPNLPLSDPNHIFGPKHMFVTAQSGQYYMHVQTGGDGDPDDKLPNVAGTIVFYALGNREPLVTLRDVPIPANGGADRQELGQYQSITLPRGVHFSPEAKALIVIPP